MTDPNKDTEQVNLIGYQPEGMVSVAWAKGYKLGMIASSDHCSTHISYALVYTGDPTRQGILDAIRKRHTYGATDNIILDVRMGEHFMGDEFHAHAVGADSREGARDKADRAGGGAQGRQGDLLDRSRSSRTFRSSSTIRAMCRSGTTTMCGCSRTIG